MLSATKKVDERGMVAATQRLRRRRRWPWPLPRLLLVVFCCLRGAIGWERAGPTAGRGSTWLCQGSVGVGQHRRSLPLRGGGWDVMSGFFTACFPLMMPRSGAVDDGDGGGGGGGGWRLLRACASGQSVEARRLLEEGAPADARNGEQQTPLLLAAEGGHLETVRALVEHGAATDAVDSKDSNALHYAAYNAHVETIRALVDAGCDVNAKNKFGYSPLQYACADGSVEAVEILLSLGADVHSHDKMRWTSLHRAAGSGHADVVEVLLKRGANVNSNDLQNYTALHEASWCGHVEIASLLVAHGARIEQTDLWNNTAVDLAFSQAQQGNDELYKFFTSLELRQSSHAVGRRPSMGTAGDRAGHVAVASTPSREDSGLAMRSNGKTDEHSPLNFIL